MKKREHILVQIVGAVALFMAAALALEITPVGSIDDNLFAPTSLNVEDDEIAVLEPYSEQLKIFTADGVLSHQVDLTGDALGLIKVSPWLYLFCDRDSKFCDHFDGLLRSVNIEPVKLPPRSPNLNAYAERFVLSIKSECLDRMILFGEMSIHHVLKEYTDHYHLERNHHGICNNLIIPQPAPEKYSDGKVECRERLGGLLKFYHRQAA